MSDGEIQWPLIVQQLVQVLPTLGGGWGNVTIYDGPSASLGTDPLFCSVGLIVPFDGVAESAGSFACEQDADGFSTRETGTVFCQLTRTTGDDDYPSVRAAVFALASLVTRWVARDRRLGGVLSPQGTSSIGVEVISRLDDGSDQTLVLALQYLTVT